MRAIRNVGGKRMYTDVQVRWPFSPSEALEIRKGRMRAHRDAILLRQEHGLVHDREIPTYMRVHHQIFHDIGHCKVYARRMKPTRDIRKMYVSHETFVVSLMMMPGP